MVTRRQALRHVSAKTLEHRVHSGRWQRVHRGIYVANNGPVSGRQRWWIACLASGPAALLAGSTAAQMCGLRGHQTQAVHVLVPDRRQVLDPPAGVVVHRTSRLARGEVNRLGQPPHTTAARSLVDAAQWATNDDAARSIIAAGFQQRVVAGEDIHALVRRMTRVRRRALILEAAADALGGAESLPEAEFVRHLRTAGLPVPRLQVCRRDAHGRTRYLDGYYDEWRLHIEVDGSQHSEVRGYWADMRRQNGLWIAGDRVLRFPSWAVRHRSSEVVEQVRAALVAAGWRPGRPRRSRRRPKS
ncbi:MAG: DUF559 domain-containing protein [Micromonosporaceae bacterium]|nr:DUF559 domain-containing protein [Micromonosporaceae bacterium]